MKQTNKILHFALLVTLLTGCGKKTNILPEVVEPEAQLALIGFSINSHDAEQKNTKTINNNGNRVEISDMQTNKNTKGTIISSETLQDFGAFGYSTDKNNWTEEASPNMFYDLKVTRHNQWNSTKLWAHDKNSFFAYAPHKTEANGITMVSAADDAGAPTIKYKMPVTAADQPDILVATPATDKIRPIEGETTGVPLIFKHKLAAVGFRITQAYGTSIESITISGIKTEGTLKIDGKDQTTWNVIDQTGSLPLIYTAGINPTVAGDNLGNIAEIDLMKTDGYLMMIPQTFSDNAKLTVKFTGQENLTSVTNLNDFTPNIEGGKHYTVVIPRPLSDPTDHTTKPANCYIAKPGEIIKFNAKLIGTVPHGSTHQTFNPNIGGAAGYGKPSGSDITIDTKSVAVKWQTAHGRVETTENPVMLIPENGITYDPTTGMCNIITNYSSLATPGGSAYVCAYDGANGTGTILWSWHIWVVGANKPILTNVTTALGDKMMDRALGAINTGSVAPNNDTKIVECYGMLYQGGRKDPFTPANTITENEVQLYEANGDAITGSAKGIGGEFTYQVKTTIINDLIQNPSTLYAIGNVGNLEHNEIVARPIANIGILNSWWNPETKTLYDPCPDGYRVPKLGTYGNPSEWTTWHGSGLAGSRTWKSRASFFPSSGIRQFGSGTFYAVGATTDLLMSTGISSRPAVLHNLYFNKDMTDTISAHWCSHAVPLRCIQE